MKIAITGHSQGIGFAIANQLHQHNIIGLSRANGYDIANISKIIDAVRDCDVFINNAYHNYFQTELLSTLYAEWQDLDKVIINIGSAITVYPRTEIALNDQPWPYREHKISLEKEFRKLSWQGDRCKLALVNPGATDTNMMRTLDCIKLNPIEIAKAVELVLNNPYIKEITVYAK
jgi:hypothetical protein